MITLIEIIKRSAEYLAQRGIENPRPAAEEVIADALNIAVSNKHDNVVALLCPSVDEIYLRQSFMLAVELNHVSTCRAFLETMPRLASEVALVTTEIRYACRHHLLDLIKLLALYVDNDVIQQCMIDYGFSSAMFK